MRLRTYLRRGVLCSGELFIDFQDSHSQSSLTGSTFRSMCTRVSSLRDFFLTVRVWFSILFAFSDFTFSYISWRRKGERESHTHIYRFRSKAFSAKRVKLYDITQEFFFERYITCFACKNSMSCNISRICSIFIFTLFSHACHFLSFECARSCQKLFSFRVVTLHQTKRSTVMLNEYAT